MLFFPCFYLKSNVNIKDIVNIIPKIKPVEGRFEHIGKIKNNAKVILDYAHTPDALKTSLINLKEQFVGHKINLLFGLKTNHLVWSIRERFVC